MIGRYDLEDLRNEILLLNLIGFIQFHELICQLFKLLASKCSLPFFDGDDLVLFFAIPEALVALLFVHLKYIHKLLRLLKAHFPGDIEVVFNEFA